MRIIDPDALLPAWFAARLCGVSRPTIGYWRRTGKLPQATDDYGAHLVDERGKPVYRYRDVVAAERDARRSGKAHRRGNRIPAAAGSR